jgi:protein-S-isoprenylcysteine O-methyltransferase Ste14
MKLPFLGDPRDDGEPSLFCGDVTIYVVIGIRFEERDLMKYHPAQYGKYKQQVPALIPFTKG